MWCKKCGGEMIGDGYTSVMHCEFVVSDISDLEPDANPVECDFGDDKVSTGYTECIKSKFDDMTESERNKYLLGEWSHSNDNKVFKQ